MESPVASYSVSPNRTEAGSNALLCQLLEWASDASQLSQALTGNYPGSQPNRDLLAIIRLRIAEAKLLAEKL